MLLATPPSVSRKPLRSASAVCRRMLLATPPFAETDQYRSELISSPLMPSGNVYSGRNFAAVRRIRLLSTTRERPL